MKTGFVTSPLFARHDTGPAHPERAERVAAIERELERSGLLAELDGATAPEAAPDTAKLVHAADYVDAVQRAIARGARVLDEGDTRVSADSWRAGLAATGGALLAVEHVLLGEWKNAFVATRPPGHHAEHAEAMGFCFFNHVAIAAAHLRAKGVARVAIVDFDVHHGNGTQHLFERDPAVFYASLHQWPLYPGSGLAHERGLGDGEGATLNCPLPPRAGDVEWLAAFDDEVLPALDRFRPQFVLVSAGFDAHADDPLSQTELSDGAYRHLTHGLVDLARRHAKGRLVSLLEGGYDLGALARCARIHVEELTGGNTVPEQFFTR
ncbi:MAG: histone deacetylase [Planctomycetes bacterium]|nr:histone deacetylase [Planctomycetota bacterium]